MASGKSCVTDISPVHIRADDEPTLHLTGASISGPSNNMVRLEALQHKQRLSNQLLDSIFQLPILTHRMTIK